MWYEAQHGRPRLCVNGVETSDLFFQAEDGIRDLYVTGVQTCALPISKLRQICDSPALVKESDRGPAVGEGAGGHPNVSTKLEELVREIEENTGTAAGVGTAGGTGMAAGVTTAAGGDGESPEAAH